MRPPFIFLMITCDIADELKFSSQNIEVNIEY